jgi:hypothetical protein
MYKKINMKVFKKYINKFNKPSLDPFYPFYSFSPVF